MLLSTTARAENPPSFVMKWGSRGAGQGEFDNARAIAVSPNGSVVYVVERWNHRIQRFTPDGSYLGESNSFVSPRSIAVAGDGSYYVLDTSASTVKKFSSGGSLITQWGSFGNAEGQFGAAAGLCVDSGGNVYVADTNNYRIQKFTSSGQFIMSWGEWGGEPGQFLVPRGVATDSNGNVYVGWCAEWGNPSSQSTAFFAFDPDGNPLWQYEPDMPKEHQSRDGPIMGPDGTIYVALDSW